MRGARHGSGVEGVKDVKRVVDKLELVDIDDDDDDDDLSSTIRGYGMTRCILTKRPLVPVLPPMRATHAVVTPQWRAVRTQRAKRRVPVHAKELLGSMRETRTRRTSFEAATEPTIRACVDASEGG